MINDISFAMSPDEMHTFSGIWKWLLFDVSLNGVPTKLKEALCLRLDDVKQSLGGASFGLPSSDYFTNDGNRTWNEHRAVMQVSFRFTYLPTALASPHHSGHCDHREKYYLSSDVNFVA